MEQHGVKVASREELLQRMASQAGISADLLSALLALEEEVPDLPSAAARNRLSQRVTELLDAALAEPK